MKKSRVFYDIWLKPNLSVDERDVLMLLWRDMNSNNKVYIPSLLYVRRELNRPYLKVEKIIENLQDKGTIERVNRNGIYEVVMKKGKSMKVPNKLWFLGDRWLRTLMLTFYVLKGKNDFLWTSYSELTTLFNCSRPTLYKRIIHLEQRGLIVRQIFKAYQKITVVY